MVVILKGTLKSSEKLTYKGVFLINFIFVKNNFMFSNFPKESGMISVKYHIFLY